MILTPKPDNLRTVSRETGQLSDTSGMADSDNCTTLSRRSFLGRTLGSAAGLAVATSGAPGQLLASDVAKKSQPERSLSLRNIHTLDEIEVTYWSDGKYIDDAVLRISHHMRDHRENETLLMDPNLLDFLWAVRQKVDPTMRFDVISGYRTPKTNAMLRKRSRNVAKFSYHMVGRAVDISTHQSSIAAVRDAGLAVKKGGVGYYPSSRFVHLDTGPLRHW